MRLLIVEDSTALRESLAEALAGSGYAVDAAADGAQALSYIDTYDYDLLVLDLMLPKVAGLDVLRALRSKSSRARVLILSARDQVEDRVAALNLGADDYLVKPFAWDELLARLGALARRRFEQVSPRLVAGELELDTLTRLVSCRGEPLSLSPKEYALLELLLRKRGRVLSRGTIFEHLYASNSDASDRVIEVLLSTLRTKMAQVGISNLIETRRGFGYVIR